MKWRITGLIAFATVILVVAVVAAGKNPVEAVGELLKGSLGSPRAITGSLAEATPLLLAGVAVFLALRAGLFNIGVEGQFLVGALASAVVGLRVSGPLGVASAMAAGALAGAIWAWPAGWIRAYRNGHEVITTIMLNNVATLMTGALVTRTFKDPSATDVSTATLDAATRLLDIPLGPVRMSSGLAIGIGLAVGLGWWLKSRVAGFELRAVGANPTAAGFAGIDVRRVTVGAMAASGGIAGLAGAVQVLAFEHRFYQGFSPGYGFDALGVALLAAGQAWAVVPAALLFGMLAKGGSVIQLIGIPKGITTIILGLAILVSAAIRYRKEPGDA